MTDETRHELSAALRREGERIGELRPNLPAAAARELDRLTRQRDMLLELVKLAGNGGCQRCIGHPLVRNHSEFCRRREAVIAECGEE